MSENIHRSNDRIGTNRWLWLGALLLWVLLLWGTSYARRGYWEPDEARFVYVAREMAAAGEWLVPHRNGVPYPDKPPLMFWTIRLGESLLPVPFGSRLPLLIGVLLSLGSVYGLGKLWRDRETGIRAAMILSSSSMFWDTGGLGQIDGFLLGLELTALFLLFRHDREPEATTPWAAFVLLGLALLAKGPVGLLGPWGVSLAVRSVDGEGGRRLGAGRLAAGLAVSVAIPLAWVAACAWSGAPAEYLRNLLFTQNVSRAAGVLGHRQPFYYFLLQCPVAFMPWTLFLPTAIACLRRNDALQLRRVAVWVGFVVIFFSLSASKRSVYILPALPALALGVASAWTSLERSRACRRLAMAVCVAGVLAGLGATGAVAFQNRIPGLAGHADAAYFLRGVSAWPFLVLAGVLAAGLVRVARASAHWLIAFALSVCLTLAALGALVYPELNGMKVPDEIRPLAAAHVPAGGRLLLYRIHGETLALHAGRTGLRCDTDAGLAAAMRLQRRGLAVFLHRDAAGLQTRFPCVTETGAFRMGSKRYVWVSFDTRTIP